MPFVSSYFRRSPGTSGTPIPPRRLDVEIYGPDAVTLLRDRTDARYALDGLTFDSALPGGFSSCSFTLRRPVAESWPGRAGLRVVVRRGLTIVWWGWIEDLQAQVQGRTQRITVTALGPWQVVQQRLCSPSYTGTMMGDAAISQELGLYCSEISSDVSQLSETNVNIAPLTLTNRHLSQLVKLVCDAGNSAGQQMLFAIWEPTFRTGYGYPTALNTNPSAEAVAPSDTYPDGWTFQWITGDAISEWTTAIYNSPSHGLKISRGSDAGAHAARWSTHPTDLIAVTAGQTYVFDYWLYLGPVGATLNGYLRLAWTDSGGGYVLTENLTIRTGTGSAFGARYSESKAAPAGAAWLRVDAVGTLPETANAYVVFDDVYVYLPGAQVEVDRRPRAWLWPRDLSAADYLLFTSATDQALTMKESTRELVNSVVASYGSPTSYTVSASDAASLALYRRRETVVDAGSSSSATVAAAVRDAYLARYSEPALEPGAFELSRPGALRKLHGGRVWPEDVRAGDRVLIADGPNAGQIVLLQRVSYQDGTVTAVPERAADVPLLLARGQR